MSVYRSGFAPQLEKFVAYKKASDRWNDSAADNLKYFDHYCADHYKDNSAVTQEMIDSWCQKRDTELNSSCCKRTLSVREFVDYLRDRGLTDVQTPKVVKNDVCTYIPYAFTHEELKRFFQACDNIVPSKKSTVAFARKLQCPAFFRLLYSSGIRTTEARYLKREDVDLKHGVLNIRKSKGYDQHYVALHETMTEVLLAYDTAIDKIQPNRTFFFESVRSGSFLTRKWVERNFRKLWQVANGNLSQPIPYDLRHNYATENIMSWEEDSYEVSKNLHYLSKSMGHKSIHSTLYYFSLVPRLGDKLLEKTETGFNEIVPEVWDDEDE